MDRGGAILTGAVEPSSTTQSVIIQVRFPCLRGGTNASGCHVNNSSAGWTNEKFPSLSVDWSDEQPQSKVYARDWGVTNSTIKFIQKMARRIQSDAKPLAPWIAYSGHHICHPGYRTNGYWYNKVNQSKIRMPQWLPVDAMHPEDAEIAMKKHLAAPNCCNDSVKLEFRSVFYAMVAEYDAMIGAILDAVHDNGFDENTWVIHSTDHGDMAFEHRSWYKMQHYDASTKVNACPF